MRRVGMIGHVGSSLALAAAAAALFGGQTMPFQDEVNEPRSRKKQRRRDPAPNDTGPVVDTTPESKRARRRRLAKEGRA